MREWGQPLEVFKVLSAVDIQKYLSKKPPSVLAINSFEDDLHKPSMLVTMLQAPLHQHPHEPQAPWTSSFHTLPIPFSMATHVCCIGDAHVPLSPVSVSRQELARLPEPPTILALCHNIQPFLTAYQYTRERWPWLSITPIALHPAMVDQLQENLTRT